MPDPPSLTGEGDLQWGWSSKFLASPSRNSLLSMAIVTRSGVAEIEEWVEEIGERGRGVPGAEEA